jgi:hypothetical protein
MTNSHLSNLVIHKTEVVFKIFSWPTVVTASVPGLHYNGFFQTQRRPIIQEFNINEDFPITYWFKAMWWFTTRKSGVNAVNLQDLLGLGSYQTAWLWLHKLRNCTIRQNRERLSGTVEADEFVIGGQQPGKRGRGANGKTIVVAAVEKEGKRLGRIRL